MSETNKPHNTERESTEEEIIPIAVGAHVVAVARSQIRRVEANGDYVCLHTPERSYLWRKTLTHLAEQWDKHGFMRTHRCHMVFLPLVTELHKGPSGHSVRLGSGPDAVDIPVSRRKLKQFKQRWIQKPRF
jgi:two-component system, LytTR family, response regulator LytT